MLTGFNTDVQHGSVVLHVQTEDKGSANPLIESLVYLGGQILDRERSNYQELLDSGRGTEAIVRLMERQHRSVIERIRGGRLDERLVALGALEPVAAEVDPDPTPAAAQPALSDILPALPEAAHEGEEPEPDLGAAAEDPAASEEVEAARAFDPDAGSTLDQVILDYLNAEADEERLVLVMDTHGDLRPGREAILRFQTRTSLADEPVEAADVRVRMITPATEPLGLGRGETDATGRLELRVTIPDLAGGAAALIINARSRVGDAELKHLI
jgi:hypothetical protein